ncbi:hypothetical protein CQW23_33470 [Capsicum baccatum]|uniref:Uncharacterized protein n=1 Tax=Capsicum baccatum TaxID=33114 RepID=A0A2G2V1Z1_CAPBA|nr:hypothetical protein CQW23_33470 [Capsicum baccatum]
MSMQAAMAPRCLGAMESWCLGALVPWCHGAMVPWCHGAMAPRCHGATVPWRHSALVPWCHGAMVPWCLGAMAPRWLGAMAPRCLGAMAPRCQAALVPRCTDIQHDKDTTLAGHYTSVGVCHWRRLQHCTRRSTRTGLNYHCDTVPPTADGFGTGTPVPSPQSQSFSQTYRSILPTSLAYIVPSTKGCSPWRPNAVMSTTGCGRHSVLRIFKGRWERTGHHATCGALLAAGPYLQLSRFKGGQAVKQKR